MNRLASLFDLEGRHAVVTGGNSGIGEAIAMALGLAGASVTLLSRRAEELEAACGRLQAQKITCDWRSVDLAHGDALRATANALGIRPFSLLEVTNHINRGNYFWPTSNATILATLSAIPGT